MKTRASLIIILLSLLSHQTLHAQQWNYYNPTSWFDVNTVDIPGPGVIAIGGGHETNDSVQIMFQSPDYGVTWNENPHDGLAPWNKSIAFSDSQNGYGVGDHGRIISTNDGGGNWGNAIYPIDRTLNKIVYVNAGTYYIAGGKKTGGSIQTILKSTNYGNTWTINYDVAGPWLKSIFFINSQKGFAIGDSGVILSTINGGNTWAPVTAPVQRDFNAITFIDANVGYIVGGTPTGTCKRTILRTINGGSNWSVLIDNIGGILKDISFADALVGCTVGDSATVLQTTDGGLIWTPIVIDPGLTGNETFNAVKFSDPNFGVVAGKAGILYVYQDGPVELYTFGLSQLGTTDATMQGGINCHSANSKYSFVYADNVQFTSSANTTEVNIQNNTLTTVSTHITGLTPNTTYYYFIKTTTTSDTVYGDTLNFFTGSNPPFVFQTLEATGVSTGGANLNGIINKFSVPVNLYFEYGTSPAFGSQIAANPATVNDTLMHNIQVLITPLQVYNQYFFRLKGVAGSVTFYGDTKTFNVTNLPMVSTQSATNITSTSAQLNGNVNNSPGTPSAIRFEYGLTSYYGTEVHAVPDTMTGTGNLAVSYQLTGLTPATYHYRIKVICSLGISYGEDMIFFPGGPSVNTSPPTNIGLTSATLNGNVNANGYPTTCKFEYGATMAYGTTVLAVPGTATGNNPVNITYNLSGLTSGTIYHYRVIATSSIGTLYGYDATFTTTSPPEVNTTQASQITSNTVQLNGTVNAAGIPSTIKFEYGASTSYGTEINATPYNVSGTGIVNVSAVLTGLVANTTYHFRIKGTNSDTTNYGSDMIFYTGDPEIPNFDFENWTKHIQNVPTGYIIAVGRISQYTPACYNNYAVKLQSDSLPGQPGAIVMGNSNDHGQTFIGGVPFNARPDTLIGCFNYSIPANDTALVLLQLKNNGIHISDNWFTIYGNSAGNFTNLKLPLHYTSSGNADTMIIGFMCTDIRHDAQWNPVNYLIVDNIRFSGTSVNMPNNDFENWDTTSYYTLDNWWYNQMTGPDPSYPTSLPVIPTMDAQHGDRAVVLHSFTYPGDTIIGRISTSQNWEGPSFNVSSRHRYLTGYYKFFPQNNDTLSIVLNMFKNHNQVGWAAFKTCATVNDYTPFSAEILYTDTIVPDSGNINIQTYGKRLPRGNSQAYIDYLNFDGFLSGVKDPVLLDAGNFDFNVYPNPFSEKATVSFTLKQDENVMVRLFDLTGKQVALIANGRFLSGNHNLELSANALRKGFYICVINSINTVQSKKIIIY